MKSIPVTTTYLHMPAAVEHDTPPPMEELEIVRVEEPKIAFYRSLYDSVGKPWHWVERRLMSDHELSHVIHDDRVEIHVLYVGSEPAGFAELDRRVQGEVKLEYFGLTPQFIGKGLGRYFLHWVVNKAWSYRPSRFWLHTCNLDHEAALPNYLEAGFEVFDRRVSDCTIPS